MTKKGLKKELRAALEDSAAGLHRLLERVNAQALFEHLTYSQVVYLKKVGELGDPTLSELAAGLGYSKPSATIAVAKLEKQGYLLRVPSKEDKRSFHILLSAHGRQVCDMTQAIRNRLVDITYGCLNEQELRTLIRLHAKIIQSGKKRPVQ